MGGQRVCWPPPSKIIGGAWPPLAPPLPTPMQRDLYVKCFCARIHLEKSLLVYTGHNQFFYLRCRPSQSITIHAKLAVDGDNQEQYQVGRQPLTTISFTVIGKTYNRVKTRSKIAFYSTGSVDSTCKQIGITPSLRSAEGPFQD